MAATRQMKQQIWEIIMNDSILKAIAQAVSSLIVEKLASNEETIQLVSNNLSDNRDFMSKVTDSITSNIKSEKDKVKQEITDSLSFDHKQLEQNCEELRKINRDLIQEKKRPSVMRILKDNLGLEIKRMDIDRLHRVGRRRLTRGNPKTKPRPVIVKFISYRTPADVFRKKKILKGSGIAISESLTRKRMELLSSVTSHPNVDVSWTLDGRIIAIRSDNANKIVINCPNDSNKL